MGYETIEVAPFSPNIGAEIFGVDLSQPLGNQAFSEIHDALMEHQVIFFRDQTMDWEQHKAFGRRFGELHIHPAAPTDTGVGGTVVDYAGTNDGTVILASLAQGRGGASDVGGSYEFNGTN